MADNLYSNDNSNLYSDIGSPEQPIVQTPDVSRQARLAAVANAKLTDDGQLLVNQLENLTQEYTDLISQYGDSAVRREAATNQQISELEGLSNVLAGTRGIDESGEIADSVYKAGLAVMAETIAQREKYALEQKAIENIQDLAAAGDHTQAKLLLNNLELGSVHDRLRDIDTKRMILLREIEKAQVAKEDQGWFLDAADFVLDFLPLNRSMGQAGNVDITDALKNWYDGVFSGQRLRNEAASLWNLSPAEFSDFVSNDLVKNIKENSTLLGYTSESERLDLWTNMYQTAPAWQTNAFNALDNVGLLPSAKALKPLTSIPSVLIRQGARKEAAETIAKTVFDMTQEGAEIAETKNGLNATDVIDNLAPSSVNINGKINQVPVTADVVTALERSEALMAELPRLQETTRFLDDAEREKAAMATLQRIEKEFGRELKDIGFDFQEIELADQTKTLQITMTLGKKEGGGFARERDARNFGNSLGYDNAKVIRDESGQYFIQVQKDFAETGFYSNPVKVQEDSVAWRLLRGARSLGDKDLADFAQVAGNRRAAIQKQVFKPVAEQFNKLKGYEREALTQILTKGSNEEKWFTEDQFNILMQRAYKRNATQSELDAYQAYRDANDIEWRLRNDEVYKNKVVQGFETASFDTSIGSVKDVNVLVNRSLDHIPQTRVYNVDEGIHYTKTNRMTQADLDRFKAQGYILITTEDAVTLGDGTRIKAFLIKPRNVSIKPLSRIQVEYRAGGHRMYKDKYFAKQARKGVQPDTQEEFLKSPGTFIAGTKKEVEQWTGKMEQARLKYREMKAGKGIDADEIDAIFEGDPAYPTAREFIAGMEDGTYSPDAPFETLFDRELPSAYNSANPDEFGFVPDNDGFSGYLRTNGRMYYSGRGERLKDYRGQNAPTLDPFETVDRALTNIANITSFSDYKISAIERWAKQFQDYTNMKGTEASAMSVFRDGILTTSSDRVKQAATAQRDIIKRNLGWKSDFDLQAEQFTRRLHEWVFSAEPGTARAGVEKAITDWWDNKNPVMALRGIAFDMKLGLFNIAQFPTQIGTAISATLLSPTHGMAGWATVIPMRAYLTKSGTEHMLQTLVDRGLHKATGFGSEAEFKEMFRAAKRSGFFDIGGTHQLINDYGPNASVSNFGNQVDRLRSAGRFFFNEAEMWNRGVAWHIAWKEVKAANPNLSIKSPDFMRKVAGRAEDYSFQMSEQSGAVWQKGLLSVPTQFWAYQARMIEALLGKTFTTEQKVRLAVGQTFLWGSAGLPVLPYLAEKWKKHTAPEYVSGNGFDSFFKVMDRGLFDWAIYGMTGADIQVGKKLGTGSWVTDTIRDIFGFNPYGETSFADIAGGATFSIMGDTASALKDVFVYAAAEGGAEGIPVKPETLKRLAMNISTASNVLKAYHIFQYGTYLSNKGNVVADGLPDEAGYAALLGYQPGQYDAVSAAMGYRIHQSEIVNDAAKIVGQYRTRMITEPTRRQELAEEINAFTRSFPPNVRQKILRKANRDYDASQYSGLLKQMEQERRRIEATEEN